MPSLFSKPCTEPGHPPSEPRQVKIHVTDEQMAAYSRGDHIQRALADQPPEVRERFLSGICPTCWDAIFGDEEVDE